MEDTVSFGAVVVNSKKIKSLQLSNLGDIACKYQWDTAFCSKYFTIVPNKGHLAPHEDVHFSITFHPNVLDDDIRFNKVKLEIDGGAADPLHVNLTGKCVPQPKEQVQDIQLSTMVRTTFSKKIPIKVPTTEACKVRVSIQANQQRFKGYFDGKEVLDVPANG